MTGLTWVSNPNLMSTRDPSFDNDSTPQDGRVYWQHALDYVAKLNTEKYLGFSDWRLPNVVELLSLDNTSLYRSYYYWSSNTDPLDSSNAIYISMSVGTPTSVTKIDPAHFFVLPVRGQADSTTSAALRKTGQTTKYAAGDDGDLQAGVAWPTPRFVENGDGTVTDKLTGLIWLQYANCFGNMDWYNALTTANTLASGACGLSDGSTAGQWRLPNVKELESLVDFQQQAPPVPVDSPFLFSNLQAVYWSSTVYQVYPAVDQQYLYTISPTGFKWFARSDSLLAAWPVRGGQMKLTTTLAGTGSGTITGSPVSASCSSGSCTSLHDQGTVVTLTATPNAGSLFVGWSGACTGSGTCSVTVDAAKTVTATFDQAAKLTVGIFGKGTVTSNPSGISCSTGTCFAYFPKNSSVVLYHTEAYGYTFSAWTSICPGTGDCTVNLTGNLYIPATFAAQDNVRRNLLTTPYGTLTTAYEAAVTSDVLKAKTMTFLESLSLGRDISVVLQGGYDPAFGTPSDFTSVEGGLTIAAGSVTLDRIIIK
ncbi:DUF1566 domain-containing protein [Trichlorobacter lovleyi]|nr:DUF1566 domain-containing protein [Trichlorobacter lovleyi]